jgi:hypothetical protein
MVRQVPQDWTKSWSRILNCQAGVAAVRDDGGDRGSRVLDVVRDRTAAARGEALHQDAHSAGEALSEAAKVIGAHRLRS